MNIVILMLSCLPTSATVLFIRCSIINSPAQIPCCTVTVRCTTLVAYKDHKTLLNIILSKRRSALHTCCS